ncbi:MAG: hypothetical protein PHO75_01285 [Candidatus Shapirobacteria bacterium]|jgi:hypothetical protein|nr:hypothetical protein [Candidatus Shapirobacteria bacterium]
MKQLLAFNLDNIKMGNTNQTLGTTYGNGGVSILVSIILKNSLIIASILLLALLIFGGISLIMNAGNSDAKKTQQGKSAITSAAIGFAIVLLAYSIIQIIQVITGLNILNSGL